MHAVRLDVERQLDRKGTALAGDGGNVDLAAEEPGHPARQREAESRSAEAPRHRAVRLAELLEDHLLHLVRDADAAVLDGVGDAAMTHVERDADLALRGELVRIAEKCLEDLHDLAAIAPH